MLLAIRKFTRDIGPYLLSTAPKGVIVQHGFDVLELCPHILVQDEESRNARTHSLN